MRADPDYQAKLATKTEKLNLTTFVNNPTTFVKGKFGSQVKTVAAQAW